MKIKLIAVLLLISVMVSGCARILEGSVEIISPYEIDPYERPPTPLVTISNLEQFRDHLLELISSYTTDTIIQYVGVDNESIQEDALYVVSNLIQNNPLAAYAVADINVTATRILANVELGIEIEYKRTAEQIGSIIDASTQRYMIAQLLDIMSGYKEEAVFLTDLQLEKEDIVNRVAELYYQNPRMIVMLPIVTVEIFPDPAAQNPDELTAAGQPDGVQTPAEPLAEGEERNKIYEVKFGYIEDTEMLREIGASLSTSIRQNAARAGGDTDGEILLSLVNNLIAGAVYDEGIAANIAMHGPQNIAATAFGALVRGNAVGEGFAMAFKALCDDLNINCRVVLGFSGDIFHAWNIVLIDGSYYHIDVAMCARDGPGAGFLMSDEDIEQLYTWDMSNTPRCNGPLSAADFIPVETPEPLAATPPVSTIPPEDSEQ